MTSRHKGTMRLQDDPRLDGHRSTLTPLLICSEISDPRLADSFRVSAPDYSGYGLSSMPDHKSFAYTFESDAKIVDQRIEKLDVNKYSLYLMDYGAPVGYRLALLHPERVQGLIVQNGNAYDEGLLAFWDLIKKHWKDGLPESRAAIRNYASDRKNPTIWQQYNL